MQRIYRYRRKRARQARVASSRMARSRLSGLFSLALIASAVAVTAFAFLGLMVYRGYTQDLKTPEEAIARSSVGGSLAFDRTGQTKLYTYVDKYGGLRDPKPLTEISPFMIAATIATEDSSFYGNPGVNFKGLARAAMENLTPFGPGLLEGSGGSSITQQLAKNVYINREERFQRRVDRKLKETVIALELKRSHEDNQILEWYLNQIFYGKLSYGAEAAAKQFFGKSAKELTLGEAALLAGLPQAPGTYDPTNPEKVEGAKARQLQVLDLMIKHLDQVNRIPSPADASQPMFQPPLTAEQIEAAKQEPLNYVDSPIDMKAPHFVLYVKDQVEKMCSAGLFEAPGHISCDKVVEQGGLRITTTLDLGLEDIAQRIVEEEVARNEARYGGHDGALVAIRPGTGEILAYIGSRDYNRTDIQGQVDIANSERSHGSTMKPLTYVTAFEQGWVPSTIVQDSPLYVDSGGGRKQINNWNFSHMGSITVRKAIAESVNTAAVRTLMEVGEEAMRDMSHRMGITDLRQGDCGPTITLGACEVKLVDMTFAYGAMANNGVMKGRPTSEDLPSGFRELDPVSVLSIQDAEGNILYQFSSPDERQVVDPAYAYMVTDILSKDAIKWSRLTIDRPAGAKTGTSEDFRDNVVMGYTPDIAAGVWMGNADNTAMAQGTFSSAGTGPMWRRFMTDAHAYLSLPAREFEKPADVVTTSCGGREEVFKLDQTPSKPGACRAPAKKASPESPAPAPKPPVFPTRTTATPTLAPTETPVLETPTPEPAPPTPVVYIVQEGDTVESIAGQFGVKEKDLRELNGLSPDDTVTPGQELLIPVDNSGPGNSGG